MAIFRLNSFTVPSATATLGRGINNSGQVTGSYQDASGGSHGFIKDGSTFTTLDDPLAQLGATFAYGISRDGPVVGDYVDNGFARHGFFFDSHSGNYFTIDDPNGTQGTTARGITNGLGGLIVGGYEDNSFKSHGFVTNFSRIGYTTLDDPNAGPKGTIADGINAFGVVVGTYWDNSNIAHGFVYNPNGGSFTTLDDPLAAGTLVGNGTFAEGINDAGAIVGYYYGADGLAHGFLLNPNGSTYSTIDDPPAAAKGGTQLFGINNSYQFSGTMGLTDEAGLAGATVVQPNDFGAPHSANVLWRNIDGTLLMWQMNGATIPASPQPTYQGTPAEPDSSWSMVGSGDFDGSSTSDMLWRNNNDGDLVEWLMNGTTITQVTQPHWQGNSPRPDASWSVAGVADFNADGIADVLWHQASTGALVDWTMSFGMDGSTITSADNITFNGAVVRPDSSWSIVGIGDATNNATADILWRQSGTGALTVWRMNGAAITSTDTPTYQDSVVTPDASWNVAGIGDFNADGSADVLWHDSNGSLAMWLMHGDTITSGGPVTFQGNVISPDASWSVIEIADFNHDGTSDILWRNTSGQLSEWLMNGNTITSSLTPTVNGTAAAPDANWSPQAKPLNFV